MTVNDNMLVTNQLAGSRTCGSYTKTEHNIIKTTLKILQKNFTGNTVCCCSLLKHVTELTFQHAVSVFSFLLLCQHDTVLRHFSATIVAMLSRREVSPRQNFVCAEDSFSKTARNF